MIIDKSSSVEFVRKPNNFVLFNAFFIKKRALNQPKIPPFVNFTDGY